MGDAVGALVGSGVGCGVGAFVGNAVGANVDTAVGSAVSGCSYTESSPASAPSTFLHPFVLSLQHVIWSLYVTVLISGFTVN